MSDEESVEEKNLRLLAELENSRKRFARERQEGIRHARADVVIGLLRPLDQLEAALSHAENAPPEVQNWAIGFKMILQQFKEAFSDLGVEPFDAEGETFDPHHHEAIEMIETEEFPPGIIVSEEMRGYRMGDRTIRPARVRVAKAPEKIQQPEEKENDGREEE